MEEVICRRGGLRKQVIEIKEGPLVLGSEEDNERKTPRRALKKVTCLGGL